ncbi:Asp-tRNA(Asn)/Glu-tRNA(Gln) amidotransferase subunit GatB [Patescibacteria group bacterium]|nr:Asp-tRNA(Asn)/Glu-tRNA(Gln) amidotransferase subunit GatB [Patescibacteria group bacterium]
MRYKPTIGLEIHVELKTKSKMFCSSKNDPLEKRANYNICPICTAQPGTLPVINQEAVKKVIKTGWALNCKIAKESKFDRKNYFYPDLPKGYQISQYDKPFCEQGYLEIDGEKIKITRIHLEEDTGRLIHKGNNSLVDFNRAGVPLMELVTEPDITSGNQARKFAEELRLIFRYLDISNADMEKGQMRVEVNISLSKNDKLGTKVEIKNLNSFRAVEKSIDYEIERQAEVLNSDKKIIQETRGWNEVKGETFSQREKEEAHDYRYFPEPDLPTMHFTNSFVKEIASEIPELPQEKRDRLIKEYNLNNQNVEIFITNKDLGEYFEQVTSELRNWVKDLEQKEKVGEKEFFRLTKIAVNYISTDLQGLLGGMSVEDKRFLINPENFAEFIALIYEGKISSKIAKTVLEEMFKKGIDPSHIIEEQSLSQMSDTDELEDIIKDVISKNPKPVEDYKAGKENALQFLAGQVMSATKGRAKPDIVQQLLKQLLE